MKSRFVVASFVWMIAACASAPKPAAPAETKASTSLSKLPRVANVGERYASYNVEMSDVIGASRDEPLDLANPRLRKLAAALGPSYVRVSGRWADTVYFHDFDEPAPTSAPDGFAGVLTRREWKGVVAFAHAVDAKLVTSFATSAGVRDADSVWSPEQVRHLLAFTTKIGGEIAAAQLFDDPTVLAEGEVPEGYDARAYARDFSVFRAFARTAAPSMRVVGPGSIGDASIESASVLRTAELLAADPHPLFDVFSYRFDGSAEKATSVASALSDEWLSHIDASYAFHGNLRDRYAARTPIWVTAQGENRWAGTFLDTFRYVDQLGRLARHGVEIVFHDTLASGGDGLLDPQSFAPRPNYWAAVLWRRLMGATVLDAGSSRPGFHVYAHCMRDEPGGVALVAINTSLTDPETLELSNAAVRYTLTADALQATRVRLEEQILSLGHGDELPEMTGAPVPAGELRLAPSSITFVAVPTAANGSCL